MKLIEGAGEKLPFDDASFDFIVSSFLMATCGLFLLLGLLTRISAGALAVTMVVAIKAAKWGDVDSLETLLGFDEFEYLALFLWLAIAGPGALSLDVPISRWLARQPK